jgi:hypothetical protein
VAVVSLNAPRKLKVCITDFFDIRKKCSGRKSRT